MRGLVVRILAVLIAVAPVAVCYGNGDAVEVDIPEAAVSADAAAPDSLGSEPPPIAIASDFEAPAAAPPSDWLGMISVRSGFVWSTESQEWTGYGTVPVGAWRSFAGELGFEIDPEHNGPTAALVALTYRLGDLREWGVQFAGAEHIGFNIGPVLRYDFETHEKELAFLVSFLDVSLDDGNVDRQRSR